MRNIFSKDNYYSLKNILQYQATYNVIFGERSNGKTYAVLKHGVEQWLQGKGQIGIIRRWQEDIRGMRASNIFSGLIANNEIYKLSKGEYSGVYYYSGKFYMCNYDEKNNPLYNDSDLLGYTFALSDTEHNKSITYPDITTVLFDEFITRGVYFQDEFVLFMNTISTIVRQRTNVKIFMLGNTVNKYCPYFDEMGLKHISKMEQGTIDLYKYGDSRLTVAVEYCSNTAKTKKNNYYFAFDNPKLNMITTGAWELDIYPHLPVKYTPKDIQLIYFIIFDGNIFQCEIVQVGDMAFTYIHEKTTPIKNPDTDIIYTLEPNPKMNYNRSIFKPTSKVGNVIKSFFLTDKVFYQDNDVGDTVNNYLKVANSL